MIKKVINFILVIVLCLPLIIFPDNIKAAEETLQDLLDNLNELEEAFKQNEATKKLTEEKINQIKSNIIQIGLNIKEVEDNIIQLLDDIVNLEEEIEAKEEEIKKLINFLQLTESKNMYLEYAFGASSMTDFIYRYSIIEQLSEYNDKLIQNMSDNIVEKNNKKESLESEGVKLEHRKQELYDEQIKLGSKMNFLDEDARSLEEEIEDAKKAIDNYKKLGCRPNDILEVCSKIPADSDFLRPINQGYISSSYGIRQNPLYPSIYSWHYAIDIGGNQVGTPIYATAGGRVVLIIEPETPSIPNSSCGGNYVVIQHNINGIYYASRYAHLHEVLVKANQIVDKNTIIGLVGGGESYDRCTTGPHLDFTIAKGIYSKDFYSFREPHTINPVTLINFPALRVWYDDRYEKH